VRSCCIRFEFPEAARGAGWLRQPPSHPNWNDAAFPLTGKQGADVGRIVVGLGGPMANANAWQAFSLDWAYRHWRKTANPAYALFLGPPTARFPWWPEPETAAVKRCPAELCGERPVRASKTESQFSPSQSSPLLAIQGLGRPSAGSAASPSPWPPGWRRSSTSRGRPMPSASWLRSAANQPDVVTRPRGELA